VGNDSCVSPSSVNVARTLSDDGSADDTMLSSVAPASFSMVPGFELTVSLRQKHHALKTSYCVPNTRKYATLTGLHAKSKVSERTEGGHTFHAALPVVGNCYYYFGTHR